MTDEQEPTVTRSTAEIRADLEHPHTAALTALHSTTVGDGPIGRLLRDVGPLLDALAAAERDRDELRGIVSAMDDDADLALIDRDEAIEAESQAGDRIAAERDAALANRAAFAEAQLRQLVTEAGRVMEQLAAHGEGIVGHLLDDDNNAGERLRTLLREVSRRSSLASFHSPRAVDR